MIEYKVISYPIGALLDEVLNDYAKNNWTPNGFSTTWSVPLNQTIVTVMFSRYDFITDSSLNVGNDFEGTDASQTQG